MGKNTLPNYPTKNSYQIGDDPIWGCEYPGDLNDDKAIAKLKTALTFGITHFIDLTEEGELKPYSHFLPSQVSYRRFPIRDVSAPKSIEDTHQLMIEMEEILKDPKNKIYLHCWGGVGRTGTIAGCWIAYSRRTDYATTMSELGTYWQQCPKSVYRTMPEHISQYRFIEHYIDYLNERPKP